MGTPKFKEKKGTCHRLAVQAETEQEFSPQRLSASLTDSKWSGAYNVFI